MTATQQVDGQTVTEDEAALYDRQIRLWGLEAQTRIRKAHILVLNLDGLTTEAIKNWVLAGISTLTVADCRERTEWHDLSAGFFWRGDDVGQERLSSAAARIQALNPLVKINVLSRVESSDLTTSSDMLSSLRPDVVVTGIPSGPQGLSRAWTRKSLITLNNRCRALSIPFYCAGTLGMNGWIFSDLGDSYQYVIERPDLNPPVPSSTTTDQVGASKSTQNGDKVEPAAPATPSKKLEKRQQRFVPLATALDMQWKDLTRAQLRRNRPSAGLFGVWAIWSYVEETREDADQITEQIRPPSASVLLDHAMTTIQEHGIDANMIFENAGVDREIYFTALATSISQPGEFSPTCAILGGVLSQDVLNALGGREEPLVNWFQLEGLTGAGPIHALNTTPSAVAVAGA